MRKERPAFREPFVLLPFVLPAAAAEAERHAGTAAAVISVRSAAVISVVPWVVAVAPVVRTMKSVMVVRTPVMAMAVMVVPVLRADIG